MKAHLSSSYTIGDAAEDMIDLPSQTCVCGGMLDPLLGKVQEGTTIRWDVWIEGNYEHRERPEHPHVPKVRD